MVIKKNKKFYVVSRKGKHLGGPYNSRAEALRRLRQVEWFKHHKK